MNGLGRRISVIGAGHVGLTTAACLAHLGHQVTCGEADTAKLARLRAGEATFFEAHLADLIARARTEGRLRFTETNEAIRAGDVIFICVGTPPLPDGQADLSAIESVAQAVARQATRDLLVIEKSTVPVRTGAQLARHLRLYANGHLRCQVVSNPEFLREGRAVEDFFHPERIVVGTDSPAAAQAMRRLYSPVLEPAGHCPAHGNCPPGAAPVFLATDIPSAELIKHASNSFLATKISFANLIADLCETTGADVATVTRGMGLDPRIGPAFLRSGIGFGGFCFPKDLHALARVGGDLGCDVSLLRAAEAINLRRVPALLEKLRRELRVARGKVVGLWGLAFKPGTDDVRFAPALEVARGLLAQGATVRAYDPQAMANARAVLPGLEYSPDPYAAAYGADAVLALTEWPEFGALDLARVRQAMRRPLLFDGRNMFDRDAVLRAGFEYLGLGCRVEAAGAVKAAV